MRNRHVLQHLVNSVYRGSHEIFHLFNNMWHAAETLDVHIMIL